MKKKARQIEILSVLASLRFATRKQLQNCCDMGKDRNANRLLGDMCEYLNSSYYGNEKVYYLNKMGCELVGEEKQFKRAAGYMEHHLWRNEAFLILGKPNTWDIEKEIKYTKNGEEKLIIPDAMYYDYEKNLCLVEIDNLTAMKRNEDKMIRYKEFSRVYEKQMGKKPLVYFFTPNKARAARIDKMANKHNVFVDVNVFVEHI